MLVRDKQAYLLDQLIGYEENEVLWLHSLSLYSQHFIFFVTYKLD